MDMDISARLQPPPVNPVRHDSTLTLSLPLGRHDVTGKLFSNCL